MTHAAGTRGDRALLGSAAACAALVFVVVASSAWLRLAATPCPAAGCEGFTLADAVRLAHRIAAMGVSVLALVIAALTWRPPSRAGLRAAAIAVIVLVAVLAFVGRRSAAGASPAVVITNLLGGLALLAACTGIAASARFAGGRCALPCLAAATLHGLALATGALLAAWPSSEGAIGLAHRALSGTALLGWGLIAFSALPPRAARAAARLAAAFLAAQVLLAVAAPAGPVARWLHNVLAAAGLCAAVAAAIAYRVPARPGRTLPAEAPARP